MFLLTVLLVENTHILAGIYFIFLKERPKPNFGNLEIPNFDLSEKIERRCEVAVVGIKTDIKTMQK